MSNQSLKDRFLRQISSQPPYSDLTESQFSTLFQDSSLVKYSPGQVLLRPDELPLSLFLVLEGSVRLLAKSPHSSEPLTLDKRGSGQLLGWVSLLRADPCEWVVASERTVCITFPASAFISTIKNSSQFRSSFSNLSSPQETYKVLLSSSLNSAVCQEDWLSNIKCQLASAVVTSFSPGNLPASYNDQTYKYFLSTSGVTHLNVGDQLVDFDKFPFSSAFTLEYRCICISNSSSTVIPAPIPISPVELLSEIASTAEDLPGASLQQLGILEDDLLDDDQRYPFVKGKGYIKETLAVVEMISLYLSTPFRKDIIEKALEDQYRRNKSLSLELVARLCELLGLNCQLAAVDIDFFTSIEGPAILFLSNSPVILYKITSNEVLIADPTSGICRYTISDFTALIDERVRFVLPRRVGTTPTSRFGWNWFTPLIGKYKRALILVFVASLLAQLFGLAIPLLIQQIIDKVLSQGNLSSLNVLGTVMVVLALFQGVLMALHTYIFVDTTDRMDLSLGSAVIDRLLALPLGFFEKRPVGELSQRLGELNSIRGFLTSTALVSILNLIFASMYLIVMIIYSPLLTAVSLSTLPLYFLLVFGTAPIYKSLIRKRAVAQARTQSHLIEVLGGIQTVKAQHFELTARWKWQDRYRDFVNKGFRSIALGATSSEIGKFLNQVSGLLVLWVGMWLVLEGDLTLGMLIAFRIISGNVTGPLLQLSGLYQGFQGVQISMERLSDIIDSNPELSRSDELSQIPLPPIQGSLRFENVSFRFGSKGPYQVDNVSVSIDKGSFVGIVGQSGSGKSTLMKLLPRLYEPENGRIFIDDYDIGKVNLSSLRRQIGIVPQDSLLFEGTIADNISLNDPQASTESIINAAKIACAHDFIMSLGQGYATPLAERGSNLSGGQRQRIAIARTVLSNPQLLVMDEATSALDYNTERQLCINLQEWSSGRTVLFITHRLSSIKNSDQILLMDTGRLIEQGTHDELIQLKQRYYTLYKQQGD